VSDWKQLMSIDAKLEKMFEWFKYFEEKLDSIEKIVKKLGIKK